jgi:NAD(P)H-dependent FMN reductase
MHLTVLSASFRAGSQTTATAHRIQQLVPAQHVATLLDAADLGALPLVDAGDAGVDQAASARFSATLQQTDAVLLGLPVYRASVSGAAKGLLDFYGDDLAGKPVGVFLAAGSSTSLLAASDLDRALTLDLGCPVAPCRLLVAEDLDPAERDERLEAWVRDATEFAARHAGEREVAMAG